MSAPETSILEEVRTEFERVLMTIQQPEYRTAITAVYRNRVQAEMVKGYPSVWYEVDQVRVAPDRSAKGRQERVITLRFVVYCREEIKTPVEIGVAAVMQDVDSALRKERYSMADNIKARSGGSLADYEGPHWPKVETTWMRPYGVAVGFVRFYVRHEYGKS